MHSERNGAPKNLNDVIDRLDIRQEIKIAILAGPTSDLGIRILEAERILKGVLRGELRDFFAHEVARYCKAKDQMKNYDFISDFVTYILRNVTINGEVKK